MFIRYMLITLVIALIGVGCSSEHTTAPAGGATGIQAAINASDDSNPTASAYGDGMEGRHHKTTFVVRIENVSNASTLRLSNGETEPVPHAPGVWTVSRRANTLFTPRRFDRGIGLEELAEDGNPSKLITSLKESRSVRSIGVFNTPVGDANPGPATPGKAYEFIITAAPGDHLSFATMFVQSNDLFYAPTGYGIPLFKFGQHPVSGDVTRFIKLWDAGTEVNQEPGLGSDQAPRQAGPDTGKSEHERIYEIIDQRLSGYRIRDKFTYPSVAEVIKVTITPKEGTYSMSEDSLEDQVE